ncbi:aminopeptidase N [Folsomia candida]|uniref:aminopeptidase N n=1 Tax=Folsomia candida TaxID=158441 RepID=UPI000B908102|nr:aminopeptidase N [Folsomia candida]
MMASFAKVLPILPFFIALVSAQVPLQLDPPHPNDGTPLNFPSQSVVPQGDEISPLYRLNGTIIPSNYELELLVLLDNDPAYGAQFTAPGKVRIDITPTIATGLITLHSYLPVINESSIQVTKPDQPDLVIEVTQTSNETEGVVQFYSISLNTILNPGQLYQLYIEFVAPISTNILNGLYLSTYVDPVSGETKRLAATQMESIHARKLFPCFDEPELKATIDLSIIRKFNYSSLANANLLSSTADQTRPGFIIDKYNKTVPMSTYLFAMVVSDFTFAEADPPTFGGKPVRAYAPPYLIARGGGNYSAQVSAELLQFFDDYFQFPYPLEKMDSAAVPQFGAGAMENYGLNLYSEGLLMYYDGETLESNRNSITSVLSHELGHQNFGNLVSLNWWTQIWLNEGFATYVANLGVDAVRPEFRARESTIGQLQNSMVADAQPNSHPLQNNVHPTAPDAHVGAITYDKGASINRMTEKFLTEVTFQKGLQYYLQDMKYQGAHSDDLFRNLDIAAAEDNRLPVGLTVKSILDTWTLQRGHPLVYVSATGPNSIQITQMRYVHTDDPSDTLWYLPVTVVSQDVPTLPNHVPQLWINSSTTSATFTDVDTSKWIMINQDATGYYRVIYTLSLETLIREQLNANASVITPLSRSQLLDDYFVMAFRNGIAIQTALDLTTYLAQEDHFTVWDVIFRHLQKTHNLLSASDSYQAWRAYLLPRLEQALLKVGIPDSPDHIGIAAIYRAKLLDWACSMQLPQCYNFAQQLFTEWAANPAINPVNINAQAVLHCAIVASGPRTAYDFTFSRYLEVPQGSPVKPRLLNGLGCSQDTVTLQDLIEKAMNTSSSLVRSDAVTAIQRVAMNKLGKPLVFTLLETRLAEVIATLGEGSLNPVERIVSTLVASLTSQADFNRLATFIVDNGEILLPINDSLQASVATMRANMEWMEEYGNSIVNWLEMQP